MREHTYVGKMDKTWELLGMWGTGGEEVQGNEHFDVSGIVVRLKEEEQKIMKMLIFNIMIYYVLQEMVTEMFSGPCVAMEIQQNDPTKTFREFCGPADPVSYSLKY